jgi:hypothetical protein
MIVLDILYVALATILVIVVLQMSSFVVLKMLYPPEPKIIYRDVVRQAPPQVYQPPEPPQQPSVFSQEVKLPEYEPRQSSSDSLRTDPVLPAGITETRPPGT